METASTAADADRIRSSHSNLDVRLLYQSHVCGLWSLIPPSGFEFNTVTLLERLETLALDVRMVDEYIVTSIARGDESEPLCVVEPLYSSLHNYSIFQFSTADTRRVGNNHYCPIKTRGALRICLW